MTMQATRTAPRRGLRWVPPLVLFVLLCPRAGRGGEREDHDHRPFISSASADLTNDVVTIRGRNLKGPRLRVRLGESLLNVISASSSEILASLPAGLAAGSYRIVVTRGKDEKHSDLFELAIVGPPGPPDGTCVDADADGFFAAPPTGTCPGAVDCNDGNDAVWPGAPEICDSLDNDCNGATDVVSCGAGVCASVADICAVPACSPRNLLLTGELCSDGLDNDCDGSIDDGVPIQPTLAGALGGIFFLLEGLGDAGVPASCGGAPEVCCTGGNAISPCSPFEAVLSEPPVVVATADPIRFDYTLRLRIKTIQAIPVNVAGFDCGVRIDTTPGNAPYVELRGQLIFDSVLVPRTFPTLGPVAMDTEIDDFSLVGGFGCQLVPVGLPFFTSVLFDTLLYHIRGRLFDLCEP